MLGNALNFAPISSAVLQLCSLLLYLPFQTEGVPNSNLTAEFNICILLIGLKV